MSQQVESKLKARSLVRNPIASQLPAFLTHVTPHIPRKAPEFKESTNNRAEVVRQSSSQTKATSRSEEWVADSKRAMLRINSSDGSEELSAIKDMQSGKAPSPGNLPNAPRSGVPKHKEHFRFIEYSDQGQDLSTKCFKSLLKPALRPELSSCAAFHSRERGHKGNPYKLCYEARKQAKDSHAQLAELETDSRSSLAKEQTTVERGHGLLEAVV
ncbi:Rna-Binding Protein 44 [Manis pentadactyla]|nr:Rna-Binding Protein 44 [Manis pentadactyla]